VNYIRRKIAMWVSGLSAAEMDKCLANVRRTTGATEIIFHFDGTVSGITVGRRTTLGRASDFAGEAIVS